MRWARPGGCAAPLLARLLVIPDLRQNSRDTYPLPLIPDLLALAEAGDQEQTGTQQFPRE